MIKRTLAGLTLIGAMTLSNLYSQSTEVSASYELSNGEKYTQSIFENEKGITLKRVDVNDTSKVVKTIFDNEGNGIFTDEFDYFQLDSYKKDTVTGKFQSEPNLSQKITNDYAKAVINGKDSTLNSPKNLKSIGHEALLNDIIEVYHDAILGLNEVLESDVGEFSNTLDKILELKPWENVDCFVYDGGMSLKIGYLADSPVKSTGNFKSTEEGTYFLKTDTIDDALAEIQELSYSPKHLHYNKSKPEIAYKLDVKTNYQGKLGNLFKEIKGNLEKTLSKYNFFELSKK